MFNKKSRKIIQNIYDELREYPVFNKCYVFAEELRLDSVFNTYITLQICPHPGMPWIIRYDFYSDTGYSPNPTGRIGSVAIYAENLNIILDGILSCGKCLGLPIKEAFIDRGGNLPFVDVYIDAYDENSKGYPFEKSSVQGVPKDDSESEAAKLYRKATEERDAKAQCDLGVMYKKGKDVQKNYAEALNWFRKAAEQGYAEAQYRIGVIYYYGEGVSKDYSEAAKWYRKAADQGYAKAQCNLGSLYYYGYGVSRDITEAMKWFHKAAEQGDENAQYNLGEIYWRGKDVAQDYTEALKWYLKAAEQGEVDAQIALGQMYRNGEGVSPNITEAVKWYRKAAEQGNAIAKLCLKKLTN